MFLLFTKDIQDASSLFRFWQFGLECVHCFQEISDVVTLLLVVLVWFLLQGADLQDGPLHLLHFGSGSPFLGLLHGHKFLHLSQLDLDVVQLFLEILFKLLLLVQREDGLLETRGLLAVFTLKLEMGTFQIVKATHQLWCLLCSQIDLFFLFVLVIDSLLAFSSVWIDRLHHKMQIVELSRWMRRFILHGSWGTSCPRQVTACLDQSGAWVVYLLKSIRGHWLCHISLENIDVLVAVMIELCSWLCSKASKVAFKDSPCV